MSMRTLISFALVAVVTPTLVAAPEKVHRSVRQLLDRTGETVHVWVLFEDKGPIDVAVAVAGLEQTYNAKAIERRRLRRTDPGLFDARDLPVHQAYVDAVSATGATVGTSSRWANGVGARATRDQIAAISKLPFVRQVQPVLRGARPETPGEFPSTGRPLTPAGAQGFYGWADAQLQLINAPALHALGYTGQGVIIGSLDTGFRTTHIAFNEATHPLQVVAEWDFVDNDPETEPEPGDLANQHNHGTLILGTMAAYLPDQLVGSAYDASYILAKVEDVGGEYLLEETWFVAGLEFIEANGGDVATSSVVIFDHYTPDQFDGLTSVMSVGVNVATANGLHVCQGIGNNGHDADPVTTTMIPPADAFQAITVGSVDEVAVNASFTSDGPTADGRVKPEVMARGVNVRTTDPASDNGLGIANGASLATPTLAGVVACLVQAHPDWTVDQMKWALQQSGDYFLAFGTHDPLFVRGYGLIDAVGAHNASPPPVGDVNEDGVVDTLDFLALLGAWGPCPDPCPPPCFADLNTDCTVDTLDFLILLANWS